MKADRSTKGPYFSRVEKANQRKRKRRRGKRGRARYKTNIGASRDTKEEKQKSIAGNLEALSVQAWRTGNPEKGRCKIQIESWGGDDVSKKKKPGRFQIRTVEKKG